VNNGSTTSVLGRCKQQKKKVKQTHSHFAIEQNRKKMVVEKKHTVSHTYQLWWVCACVHERTRKKASTKQQKRKENKKKAI
jgi:hypothetical protein